MSGRLELLRTSIARSDKIIEIGPCHNPIVPKRDGWRAFSIDHTDQAGLRAKYRADPSVNLDIIEPVDFVWNGGDLSDAVPVEHHHSFDVFVASHVIEHSPNLVGFLHAAETLTTPEGVAVLAIPDKRVSFDCYRPASTIGGVLEAYAQNRTRHSTQTLWDYFFHLAVKNESPGWTRLDTSGTRFVYPFADAIAYVADGQADYYVDAHGWVFVPSSFQLILLVLARLELTDWQVERSEQADATEFYVWLRKGGAAKATAMTEELFSRERHRLLDATLLELDEQSVQWPDSIANRRGGDLQSAVAQLQHELDATRNTLGAVRASIAWRTRGRLRRLLGLSPTVADR